MILIGSVAFSLRAPGVLSRIPKDYDWVCTKKECEDWIEKNSNEIRPNKILFPNDHKVVVHGAQNCEFEIITPGYSSELLVDIVSNDPNTYKSKYGLVPTLDVLFAIKTSHRYLKNSPHFWKNLLDYHLMKNMGAKIDPSYKDFLKLREKETYNYSHPKLNTSKDNFFRDDQVSYTYDHDSIHQAVKHLDRPAYTFFQKEGAEVACDKNKFFSCSREIQLYSVVEESSVLAIERSLVPFPKKWSLRKAWHFAFSKVCTSISSGWWREFAYENALDCLKLYSDSYWNKFENGLTNGIVKPFVKSNY